VEACADENANIIYGQIIDESLGDQVRITVIATGFTNNPQQGNAYDQRNLFANTTQAPKPAQPAAETYNPAPSYSSNNDSNRFSDEDYIPDFLKR
jgi:cell division protein FtsZ